MFRTGYRIRHAFADLGYKVTGLYSRKVAEENAKALRGQAWLCAHGYLPMPAEVPFPTDAEMRHMSAKEIRRVVDNRTRVQALRHRAAALKANEL